MRNIFEHPVTKEEVLRWIEMEEQKMERMYENNPINIPVGDMTGEYLKYIKEHLT